MEEPVPLTTAIVLNWNGRDDTLACLHSLAAQTGVAMKVVVVDNGSSDDSVRAIRDAFPEVEIIETGKNLGYAGGNNVGIRHALSAGAEYIFVVNNDTVVEKSCLSRLVVDLRDHGDAGAASPKSLYYDSPDRIYYAGGRIDADGTTIHCGCDQPDGATYSESQDTEWLTGCAILFRADALRKVGLFDPDYYLLYEDVDWSMRARRMGMRLRFVASAVLWHKVSTSFGTDWSPQYLYYFTRNAWLFYARHYRRPERAHFQSQATRRALSKATRAARARGRRYAPYYWSAVLCGLLDYKLRRFGPSRVKWHVPAVCPPDGPRGGPPNG